MQDSYQNEISKSHQL